jgi:4-aminobutyrate aminotransferase
LLIDLNAGALSRGQRLTPEDPGVSALLERHRNVMPSWISLYCDEPMELARGEGRRVWDGEGRCYLDFFGGILTTMTGYALPEVVEAVRE